MYCSSCGNSINKGLVYCSSCGKRVEDQGNQAGLYKFQSVSTALGFVGLGGLIGFIFLVKLLLDYSVVEGLMALILVAYLATVFGISAMLVRLLPRGSSENSEQNMDARYHPPSIESAQTHQLNEATQAPASVVENTTRTLEEVPVERK